MVVGEVGVRVLCSKLSLSEAFRMGGYTTKFQEPNEPDFLPRIFHFWLKRHRHPTSTIMHNNLYGRAIRNCWSHKLSVSPGRVYLSLTRHWTVAGKTISSLTTSLLLYKYSYVSDMTITNLSTWPLWPRLALTTICFNFSQTDMSAFVDTHTVIGFWHMPVLMRVKFDNIFRFTAIMERLDLRLQFTFVDTTTRWRAWVSR